MAKTIKYERVFIRPSNSYRTLNCSMSCLLPTDHVEEETLDRLIDGQAQHARLEQEHFLDNEANCAATFNEIKTNSDLLLHEKTITIYWGRHYLEGTIDVIAFKKINDCYYISILDWKTGRSVYRTAKNSQLLTYCFLAYTGWPELQKLYNLPPGPISLFKVFIAQTSLDEVVSALVDIEEIANFGLKISQQVDLFYNQQSFNLNKGRWCGFCPCKKSCPHPAVRKNISKRNN